MIELEILDYDIEGAAYNGGAVVDGAFLLATVKRRPVVDASRTLVSPPGEAVRVRVDLAGLPATTRAELFEAFGGIEGLVKDIVEADFASKASGPAALDAAIAAADAAKAKAEAAAEKARVEIDAKAREAAELDAQIATKRAELAALAKPADTPDGRP